MVLLAGEVIYIVKCVLIEIKLTPTTEFYEQLPVLCGNTTYFLIPQTHILLRQGTQITCNSFALITYLLGDAWCKFMPKPVETISLSFINMKHQHDIIIMKTLIKSS